MDLLLEQKWTSNNGHKISKETMEPLCTQGWIAPTNLSIDKIIEILRRGGKLLFISI